MTRPVNAVTESKGNKRKVKLRFPLPHQSDSLTEQTNADLYSSVLRKISDVLLQRPKQLIELEKAERNLSSISSQLI